MADAENEYYARRAQEETRRADAAACEPSRHAHASMARRYRAMVDGNRGLPIAA